jgi:hypothetical protein
MLNEQPITRTNMSLPSGPLPKPPGAKGRFSKIEECPEIPNDRACRDKNWRPKGLSFAIAP